MRLWTMNMQPTLRMREQEWLNFDCFQYCLWMVEAYCYFSRTTTEQLAYIKKIKSNLNLGFILQSIGHYILFITDVWVVTYQ